MQTTNYKTKNNNQLFVVLLYNLQIIQRKCIITTNLYDIDQPETAAWYNNEHLSGIKSSYVTCTAVSPPRSLFDDPLQCYGSSSNLPAYVLLHVALWINTRSGALRTTWLTSNTTKNLSVSLKHSSVMYTTDVQK